MLLRDQLSQVPACLGLARATFSKIRQNLAWAFAYNALGVPLAAGALLPAFGLALTPSAAGALMSASSLAVMANSLTLQLHGRRLGAPTQLPAPDDGLWPPPPAALPPAAEAAGVAAARAQRRPAAEAV